MTAFNLINLILGGIFDMAKFLNIVFILSLFCFSSEKCYSLDKKGVVTHVTVTCYQPVEAQCDSGPLITADGSKIDLHKLKKGDIKWCAISRDLLWLFPKDKPKRVYIEGYGIYEVRDVMNNRFNHRLDILLHPSDDTLIKDENVKVIILS